MASEEKLETVISNFKISDSLLPSSVCTASMEGNPILADIRNNPIILTKKQHSIIQVEECDRIVLKNGVEILGKVTSVSSGEIKYKQCNNLNGAPHFVSKSEVNKIKYANGKEEIISPNNQAEFEEAEKQKSSKDTKDAKVQGMCLLGILLAVVGLIVAGVPLGILAIIFGISGLVTVAHHKDKYKGKGLGIVAVILGIIDIIGAAIYIAKKKT